MIKETRAPLTPSSHLQTPITTKAKKPREQPIKNTALAKLTPPTRTQRKLTDNQISIIKKAYENASRPTAKEVKNTILQKVQVQVSESFVRDHAEEWGLPLKIQKRSSLNEAQKQELKSLYQGKTPAAEEVKREINTRYPLSISTPTVRNCAKDWGITLQVKQISHIKDEMHQKIAETYQGQKTLTVDALQQNLSRDFDIYLRQRTIKKHAKERWGIALIKKKKERQLTPAEVSSLRQLYIESPRPTVTQVQEDLLKKFGVNYSPITVQKNAKKWSIPLKTKQGVHISLEQQQTLKELFEGKSPTVKELQEQASNLCGSPISDQCIRNKAKDWGINLQIRQKGASL